MKFNKLKILTKGFFHSSIPIRGFFRKLIGLPYNVEHTRAAMRLSYNNHVLAAKNGKIPVMGNMNHHTAGIYGMLASRYMSAGIWRPEFSIWAEISPFLLMKESDAVECLAEYVVCLENPQEARVSWLSKLINNALRFLKSANSDYRAMVINVLIHRDIYWRNFLEDDVKEILENEFLEMFPAREEIAPEIYNLLDQELQRRYED